MAKLVIKSDNITPFGGLYSIFNLFSASSLRRAADAALLIPQGTKCLAFAFVHCRGEAGKKPATARQSLTDEQVAAISKKAGIIAIPIPTIETVGGGSIRCMMAEIYPVSL